MRGAREQLEAAVGGGAPDGPARARSGLGGPAAAGGWEERERGGAARVSGAENEAGLGGGCPKMHEGYL